MTANRILENWLENQTEDLGRGQTAALHTSEPSLLRRILVPVDFSECSRRALQLAVALATDADADVVLFHVRDSPPDLRLEEGNHLREQALEQLEAWLGLLSRDCRAKAIFRQAASAGEEILRMAAEQNVQLIVMGRHSGLCKSEFLMGSTAKAVFLSATCAVLVTASVDPIRCRHVHGDWVFPDLGNLKTSEGPAFHPITDKMTPRLSMPSRLSGIS